MIMVDQNEEKVKRMRCTAIILAAGKGSRMKSNVQKQFMELDGYPLIYYAIRAFEHSCVTDIILVVEEGEVEYCCTHIIEKYQFQKVSKVVPGGSERYLSVYQGLLAAEQPDIVLVHDGARPFVTNEIIERTIHAAEQYGSGVAAMPMKDTVKIADAQQFVIQTPARENVWMVQTPQAFRYEQIRCAYEKAIERRISAITDDAMVMEQVLHEPVKLVEGSYRNIKVTTPEDMEIAGVFVKQ